MLGLALSIWLGVIGWQVVSAPQQLPARAAPPPSADLQLPPLTTYPVPPRLAAWQDPLPASSALPSAAAAAPEPPLEADYLADIEPTAAGYLIWTQFPVTIYAAPPAATVLPRQAQQWQQAIDPAIAAWTPYLDIVRVNTPADADIVLQPERPPLRRLADGTWRSRAAETRYQLYRQHQPNDPSATSRLIHRCTIFVRPDQSQGYIEGALRHELGHALGLWGHSPEAGDVMYFSQTASPARLSDRDIRTLQRLYAQPTRLGGEFPSPAEPTVEADS